MVFWLTSSIEAIMTALEEDRMEVTEDDMAKAKCRRDARIVEHLMNVATLILNVWCGNGAITLRLELQLRLYSMGYRRTSLHLNILILNITSSFHCDCNMLAFRNR